MPIIVNGPESYTAQYSLAALQLDYKSNYLPSSIRPPFSNYSTAFGRDSWDLCRRVREKALASIQFGPATHISTKFSVIQTKFCNNWISSGHRFGTVC